MKGILGAFTLSALAAATVAFAQQATPPTTAEPPTSTAAQEQSPSRTTAPSESRSTANKEAMMKDCVTQVQAANPSVPAKEVKDYCDKQVKSYTSSPR